MEKQKGLKLCAFPPLNCSPTTSTGPRTAPRAAPRARARRARAADGRGGRGTRVPAELHKSIN